MRIPVFGRNGTSIYENSGEKKILLLGLNFFMFFVFDKSQALYHSFCSIKRVIHTRHVLLVFFAFLYYYHPTISHSITILAICSLWIHFVSHFCVCDTIKYLHYNFLWLCLVYKVWLLSCNFTLYAVCSGTSFLCACRYKMMMGFFLCSISL